MFEAIASRFEKHDPGRAWRGMFLVESDGQPLTLLVYQQWVEMFWARHRIMPLRGAAPTNAFWYQPRAIPVRNLWTGEVVPTFAAGSERLPTEQSGGLITLRSLHPRAGAEDTGLRHVRGSIEPFLQRALAHDLREVGALLHRAYATQ